MRGAFEEHMIGEALRIGFRHFQISSDFDHPVRFGLALAKASDNGGGLFLSYLLTHPVHPAESRLIRNAWRAMRRDAPDLLIADDYAGGSSAVQLQGNSVHTLLGRLDPDDNRPVVIVLPRRVPKAPLLIDIGAEYGLTVTQLFINWNIRHGRSVMIRARTGHWLSTLWGSVVPTLEEEHILAIDEWMAALRAGETSTIGGWSGCGAAIRAVEGSGG